MSRVALLDVNVLVALFDPDHVHHEAAHAWFAPNRSAPVRSSPVSGRSAPRAGTSSGPTT